MNWKLTFLMLFEGTTWLCGITRDGFLTGCYLASPPLSKLMATLFHGAHSKNAAKTISRTGFVANVARTNGWLGEGVHSSLRAGKRYLFLVCCRTVSKQATLVH